MSEHPQIDKLAEVIDESQAIVDFLDWISSEKGIVLAVPDEYGYSPARLNTDHLLMEFWGIDHDKLEDERRTMLEDLQRLARAYEEEEGSAEQ